VKIAFIKQKFVPFGGGEGVLACLMHACVERGHAVHLLTGYWPPAGDDGYRVHVLSHRRATRALRMRSFSAAAADFLHRNQFDVSLSFDRTEYQDIWRAGEGVHRVWLERRRLFEPRMRCLLNEHLPGQRAIIALERRCVGAVRRIVANSRMVRDDILRVYGDGAPRIDVIYNGVDHERFSPAGRDEARRRIRAEYAVPEDLVLALFAGSGFRRKGLKNLLQALVHLPEVFLLVVGRDSTTHWRRQTQELGLSRRVRFLNPQADLAPLYRAADIFLLPTWFDAFPNVVLEAIACGTPVVTTVFGGAAEIVQRGKNGAVISRPDRIPEMVAAVREVVGWSSAGGVSPEDVAATAAAFSIESCSARFLDVLEETGRKDRG